MEFPANAAVTKERYSAERNEIEDERKGGLEGNPDRGVGADWSVDYGYVELQSSLTVSKEAVRCRADPYQGE